MKNMTYKKGSSEDVLNRLALKRLKLARALEQCDYDDANIACAQIDYLNDVLARVTMEEARMEVAQ